MKKTIHYCIYILVASFIVSCFEVEGDPFPEIDETAEDSKAISKILTEQTPNKDVTALLVTNTNGKIDDSSESVGSVPQPSNSRVYHNTRKSERDRIRFISGNPYIQHEQINKPAVTRAKQLELSTRPLIDLEDSTYNFYGYTYDENQTQTRIILKATQKYGSETSKCLIYLEDDSVNGQYDTYDFTSLGEYFDTIVYPEISEKFAEATDVDQNGKTVILFYDMGVGAKNILGFFYRVDLYGQSALNELYPTQDYKTNQMELFYANLSWSQGVITDIPASEYMRLTLAHEYQHLASFGYRLTTDRQPFEVWIDEGLAVSAEHVVNNGVITYRIDDYNDDDNKLLRNGLSLVVWKQELENYSLSYTFLQYARIHSGLGDRFYRFITESTLTDQKAITSVLKKQNSRFSSFSVLLRSYRLANILQQSTGVLGYGSENDSFNMTAHNPTADVKTVKLLPGGAITIQTNWNKISNSAGDGKGENIKYSKIHSGFVTEM
jgi:hypothetical protein